ncbi:hypothetical protein TEA_024631 [Camellia sinensis var. sinensis]|uniref:SnoaL-like domain-containing protein n=1 Tax=Camellia sinensis var. sinensis TaxID=542762 RepID=A0A4V3WQM8_CAMSN|nr:hypothetical protein TEA_024631 [Camellia sinensis var. sinensis]
MVEKNLCEHGLGPWNWTIWNEKVSIPTRYKGSSMVALGAKNSGSGEEDNRALETVLKLYTAIGNRNISELSDVIAEECRCVSNFISIFQSFHGKKQVVDFFSTLMKCLGNNIQFVVQPTLNDGMNVSVAWRLEWNTPNVLLGKGFGFYTCHIYQGKVVIRNVEMFMEPLLHIEPLRLKMMGVVLTVMDKIGLYDAAFNGKKMMGVVLTVMDKIGLYDAAFNGKVKKAIYLLLILPLMTALLFLFVKLFRSV